VTISDLAFPRETVSQFESAICIVEKREQLKEWGLRRPGGGGFNPTLGFHGPPGTGKSAAAEALAHFLGKKLLVVPYQEIESRYHGDTPKNIVELFSTARSTDAVLFFDEADAMLSKRLTTLSTSTDISINTARSVLLKELEGHNGIVIFSTNNMENYDPAFVRRILAHVEFRMPTQQEREQIWLKLLVPTAPYGVGVDPKWCAAQSEGMAGGDMVNALFGAAVRALKRLPSEIEQEDILAEIVAIRQAYSKVSGATFSTRSVSSIEDIPESLRDAYKKQQAVHQEN
jgi:AAA+ superfamily predicted ATPase